MQSENNLSQHIFSYTLKQKILLECELYDIANIPHATKNVKRNNIFSEIAAIIQIIKSGPPTYTFAYDKFIRLTGLSNKNRIS